MSCTCKSCFEPFAGSPDFPQAGRSKLSQSQRAAAIATPICVVAVIAAAVGMWWWLRRPGNATGDSGCKDDDTARNTDILAEAASGSVVVAMGTSTDATAAVTGTTTALASAAPGSFTNAGAIAASVGGGTAPVVVARAEAGDKDAPARAAATSSVSAAGPGSAAAAIVNVTRHGQPAMAQDVVAVLEGAVRSTDPDAQDITSSPIRVSAPMDGSAREMAGAAVSAALPAAASSDVDASSFAEMDVKSVLLHMVSQASSGSNRLT